MEIMGLKDSYKIFFAIPFDCESRSIYDKYIIRALKKKYRKKLKYVVGNKQIGHSKPYDDIETFKMQNSALFEHFIKQIRSADIIIADLTDNNPNVHVELGIALSYNKNILRVTRQSYEMLGFDVRNYEVHQYNIKENLLNIIEKYMELFFKIKELDFTEKNSKLYYFSREKKVLNGKRQTGVLDLNNSNFYMRDGKIRVTFKITDQVDDTDWFGVYLRVGDMGCANGSILVYVRKSGELEIATYPGPKRLKFLPATNKCIGHKTLTIELEGDYIKAEIESSILELRNLNIQYPGSVQFASFRSNSEFWDTQIVCRDTIEAFDRFAP